MKTGLGLNFLRVVNEEGSDGWAQVYARIPFEEDEILKKGALFGVIYSSNLSEWTSKEAEVMTWVDETFNSTDKVGDLTVIDSYLRNEYPEMSSVWLWISLKETGEREIRLIRTGNVDIWLWRGDNKIDLGDKMLESKILKGIGEVGDKLMIWAGDLPKDSLSEGEIDSQETVNRIGDKLMKDNVTGAGLVFTFKESEHGNVESEEVENIVIDNSAKADLDETNKELVKVEDSSRIYRSSYESEEQVKKEIVSDRYIGKVGPKENLINWWRSKSFKSRGDISVGQGVSKRKRMAVGLGLLFLFLLVISIVSGSIKIKADKERKEWEAFYQPIEKKRLDALGLTGVNLVGSRRLMEEVKKDFETGKGVFVNGKYKNELADLENKINSSWSTALGEKQSAIENQIDIGLVRSGFMGSRLSLIDESEFLVLDNKMGVVVTVESGSKEINVVAGKGESSGWVDVVSDTKNNYLLEPGGVLLVDSLKKQTDFDAAVAKPVSMGVFGSNMYILDQVNKEIYRYTIGSDTFGDRVRWMKQEQVISKTPLDMAIDGDIWVLEEGNTVERFRRGVKENFSLNGEPEEAKFSRIGVEIGGDRIALLDETNQSVSIFNKEDGSFVQQLRQDVLLKASDLEFDEDGSLWVLYEGKIGVLK